MVSCPNCQFSNNVGANFCSGCGTTLSPTCTNCSAELLPEAKFCSNCGHAQNGTNQNSTQIKTNSGATETSQTANSSALEKYMPAALVTKLESARDSEGNNAVSLGERRILTMVFCDIQGSTAAAENLDPEEWHEIVNGAFEHMIAPVYHYEGTIARLMGDGILAFFGAPIAHEDDPQRAILASLKILEGVEIYRKKTKKTWGIDINVRVGINTGLVVVGGVGSDLRMEYTALGDAINLAARMEQTAEPGTIQISQDTHRLVSPIFSFKDLGGVEVKGKKEPVQAYQVLGIKTQPGQIRGIEGLDSPLIGRDLELNTLCDLIVELRAGRGQIVSVMGEAGLGKSRLLAEVQKSKLPAEGIMKELWLEGRSLSYETLTPYAPFIQLFRSYFDLESKENDNERYQSIKENLELIIPKQVSEFAPYLATMLGVGLPTDAGERVRYLTPPQLREGIFKAVCSYLENLASTNPLVLVLDDFHWIDPTSLEMIEQLLPLTEHTQILLMTLFRPRRQETSWHFHETAAREYAHRYKSISLEPLNQDNSRILVENLLDVDEIPSEVRSLILEKAEGNPFYVEEVIRSMLDTELIVRKDGHWKIIGDVDKISVPNSLSAVITTRLDRLVEDSRQVAQTAAVIGRQFSYSLLESVHFVKESLDPALIDLQKRDLIWENNQLQQRTFSFRHNLTQETVYDSMLLKKRRVLHKDVAECLEVTEPEKVNQIAYHFFEAKEFARALPYLVEAGDKAAKSYSAQEAIELYSRAISIFEKVDAEIELARSAFEGLGGTYEFAYDFPKAIETYRQMISFGETYIDIPMQISGKNKLAKALGFGTADFVQALTLLTEAEDLAKGVEDLPGLAEGSMIQCAFCTARADFDGAVNFLGQAVEIGRQLKADEPRLYGLTHIANTYTFMGLFEDAWKTVQEAKALAKEVGNQQYIAELLTFSMPYYHLRNGDITLAKKSLNEGISIAEEIGSITSGVSGYFLIGHLAQIQGNYEEALNCYQKALDISGGSIPYWEAMLYSVLGSTYFEISPKLKDKVLENHSQAKELLTNPIGVIFGATDWTELGFCELEEGNLTEAESYFEKGLNTPTAMMHLYRPHLLVGSAFVDLAKNDLKSAHTKVTQAIDYIQDRQMKHLIPFVQLAMGKVNNEKGDFEKAIESFEIAEKAASDMELLPLNWQIHVNMAKSLGNLKMFDKAQEKLALAKVALEKIEEIFQDSELQNLFSTQILEKIGGIKMPE